MQGEKPKRYHYVGASELLALTLNTTERSLIETSADVVAWAKQTEQAWAKTGEIVATFIVDESGALWIADRHSEHVACARGGPVLSAGEITFQRDTSGVTVSAVSNQSTGFCPEPESWPAVANALESAGLTHPGAFTSAFDFRRCPSCQTVNLVKDGDFVCAVCGATLDPLWNFGRKSCGLKQSYRVSRNDL